MDGNEWWESLSVAKTTEPMKMLLKFNIYPLKLFRLTFDAPDLQQYRHLMSEKNDKKNSNNQTV